MHQNTMLIGGVIVLVGGGYLWMRAQDKSKADNEQRAQNEKAKKDGVGSVLGGLFNGLGRISSAGVAFLSRSDTQDAMAQGVKTISQLAQRSGGTPANEVGMPTRNASASESNADAAAGFGW